MKLVDELMAQFEYALECTLPHFEKFDRINRSYGNRINSLAWPTISEISIPWTFISVEEQLPFIMQYLFPKNRWIKVIPQTGMVTEKLRLIEDDLRYTLLTEMNIQDTVHRSIRDCYKYAVGYGMIDTEWIIPEERVITQLMLNGQKLDSTPIIRAGQPVQIVTYEYIPVVCVIPMPDGANVERPNKASAHFVLRLKKESELRDMYKRAEEAGDPLKGDIDKIIEEARTKHFDARMMPIDILASLANVDVRRKSDKRIPVIIPILQYYGDNQHTWIANGTTIIYDQKNTYQTMRSDLIKWSAWPDGNNWFPMGITEASERLAYGSNVWYNGLIDLAMYHMNPTRVINTGLIDTAHGVERGPRGDIHSSGPANQAVHYLELPQFPQQLFMMGDMLQSLHGLTNAQPSSMRNAQAGLVRGGTNALETLLSTTTGRQLLAAMACKTGGMQPLVEKTLIKKQLLIDQSGRKFVTESFNSRTGESEFHERNVTLEDLRHVFRVELNLPVARMNSAAAFTERASYFDRAQQRPELFDQRALFEELTDDYDLVRRTMLPEDVVREREERMAEASLRRREEGQTPEQEELSTQGMQALQGAAAIGGEM